MFMSISRIASHHETDALLYQSIIVSELPRPPLPLFAFDLLADPATPADRIVSLCSFCQMVAWPVGARMAQEEWIEAAEYYRRGGKSGVAVSHGICDVCSQRFAEATEPALG